MYLRNCWYPAATTEELGPHLLARRILEEPIVLFRKENKQPVAIEDRCSHRFYPLSKGDLQNDIITCRYHGLEFDFSGACVRVPGQTNIPLGANVRSYPVADKWGLLWIWMGEPRNADETLIPNLWTHDHPEWRISMIDRLDVDGDYRLLADNLLDPSHVAFLHKTTLGSDVAEIPHETEVFDEGVRVTRWTINKPAAPIFTRLHSFNGNVDRWQIMTFRLPNFVEVDLGSCDTGTGAQNGDRSHGIEMRSYNIATPCKNGSFHYFLTHARNYALDNSELSKITREQVLTAVAEDVEAMELVHEGFARHIDKKEINTRADGAGLRARRMVAQAIECEQSNAPAVPA